MGGQTPEVRPSDCVFCILSSLPLRTTCASDANAQLCTRTYTRDERHRERTTIAFSWCDVAAEVDRDYEIHRQQGT